MCHEEKDCRGVNWSDSELGQTMEVCGGSLWF